MFLMLLSIKCLVLYFISIPEQYGPNCVGIITCRALKIVIFCATSVGFAQSFWVSCKFCRCSLLSLNYPLVIKYACISTFQIFITSIVLSNFFCCTSESCDNFSQNALLVVSCWCTGCVVFSVIPIWKKLSHRTVPLFCNYLGDVSCLLLTLVWLGWIIKIKSFCMFVHINADRKPNLFYMSTFL